jgi:hypothetical protein
MGMAEPPIRPQIGGFGVLSRAKDRAQFALLGRVFAFRVILTSNDVANFAVWLSVYCYHNVPAFRFEAVGGNVIDVPADLEVVHGVARWLV